MKGCGYLNWIQNKKERARILIALLISISVLIFGFTGIFLLEMIPLHTRLFVSTLKKFGSLAKIGCLFAVAIYPVFFLLRHKLHLNFKILIPIARFMREWHVPIAVLSLAFAIAHSYMAIVEKWSVSMPNVTGIFALTALGIVCFSGFLKYKKGNQKMHRIAGFVFIIFLLLHIAVV